MGSGSMVHWLVVAVVVLVLFGRGKIAATMGDFGKGVKSFRKGLAEDDPSKRQLPSDQSAANPTFTRSDAEAGR